MLFVNQISVSEAQEEDGIRWTYPERIPNYPDEGKVPIMVADQDQTIHAFYEEPTSGRGALFYRTWTIQRGWSSPIDILINPIGGNLVIHGAEIDHADNIHLIFYAGTQFGSGLYHTSAPATEAASASSWTDLYLITNGAGPFGFGSFTMDRDENFYVVYGGTEQGQGIYAVQSKDFGVNWTEPLLLSLSGGLELYPAQINLDSDGLGNVHAVWSIWSSAGVSELLQYTQFEGETEEWRKPFTFAVRDEGEYEADHSYVLASQNDVFIMYQDGTPAQKNVVFSQDGGNTWSDPLNPYPHVGEYGFPILLKDSSNLIHVLTGNRDGDCCHGMWHGTYEGGVWSPLSAIIQGPKTPRFDPSSPQAIMSQGNVILVTWWTDTGGAPRNGVWYSYGVVPTAEEEEIVPLRSPTPTIPPTLTPTPIVAEAADRSNLAELFVEEPQYDGSASSQRALYFGFIGTAAALGIGILLRFLFSFRS